MRNVKRFWQRIYLEKFGLKVNFSKLIIPKIYDPQDYFIVLMPKNLSLEKILKVMEKEFGFWFYTDIKNLKSIFDKKDLKVRKNSLAVFKRSIHPEIELINNEELSAFQKEKKFINIIESTLLELMFFYQSGGHLDSEKETVCFSTVDLDGYPAVTFWDKAKKEFSIFFLEEESMLDDRMQIYSREKVYEK